MNKTKYMQTDSRWGGLGYPRSPYFLRNCGCGEVSICNCIIEMDKYKNQTPKTIQPYCKQYADPNGNGTYWSGIPAMMKHYGMTEVKEHGTMAQLWTEMKKGDRVCILLMGNKPGGSKRVHWTSSGHFIAGVSYKKSGSEHYLYIKDSYSNASNRNGWLGYSTHLKNDVIKVWSGKLATQKKAYYPTTAYKGKLPTKTVKRGDKGTQVKYMKDFLAWRYNYKFKNDNFGPTTEKRVKHFQKNYAKKYGLEQDGVWGPATRKAAQAVVDAYAKKYPTDPLQKWYDAMTTQFNWSKNQIYDFNTYPTVENSKKEGTCITFPAVSLQRLGLLPKGGYFYLYPNTGRIAGNSIGVNYVKDHPEIYSVTYPNKTIAQLGTGIKKGDIIGFTEPAYHTMVYMGKNSNGEPIFNTMGHTKGLSITYPYYASRKVNMIVRLKKV